MDPRSRALRVALALAWLVPLAMCATAVDRAHGLVRQERLVHRFDFLETDDRGNLLGRGHTWPPNWYPIGRPPGTADPAFLRQPLHQQLINTPGHPRYTRIGYDDRHTTVGDFALHIGLDGGNAGAYLEVGAVPAVPGSDYLITADVRTEGLALASGRLTGYLVDGNGRRIDGSVHVSDPIDTRGEWTTVSVTIPGDFDRAAWLGLEVALAQPTADPAHPLGAQQIVLQDVTGDAWFDNICIWQVPHVSVRTQSPVNLIHAPTQPTVEARVRDLSGRQLTAALSVYDHHMQRVDHEQFVIGQGAPMRWRWTPDLPSLGWYLVELNVHDRGEDGTDELAIARSFGALLWLPPHEPLRGEDRYRFALPAEDVPHEQWDVLPGLLEATGLTRTVVSAWQRHTTSYELEERVERIDTLLQELSAIGGDLQLSLYPVPDELAEHDAIDTRRPLEMLAGPTEAWQPYLAPILMRHGPRVRHWHLGLPHEAAGVFDDDLPRTLGEIRGQLRRMAPRPRLVVPWRLDHARHHGLDRSPAPPELLMDIDVPPHILPEHIDDHLESWHEPAIDYTLSLRVPPADELAHPRRVADLTLRMIHAWRHEPGALQLRQAWTAAAHREPAVLPDPLLGVFSNVAHQLAGRRVVGELTLADGLRCLILDGSAGGALVAWNVSAAADDAVLEMALGARPIVHDVWGNHAELAPVDGLHRVELDTTPVFITGIDPELALFRAGFGIDEPFIESRQVPHDRTIELTNPWPRTISGHMQIVGPERWQYQPARHFFSIPAGESTTLPLRLQFPIAEVAGSKTLRARFEFTADREHRIMMSLPLELGLPDFEFDATLAVERGEGEGVFDAVVTCIIANRSDRPQALYVFANLVGHARQERLIGQLEPGESVVRRFRFQDAGNAIQEHAIRAGLRETDGPAILNHRLTVDTIP